MEFGTRIRRLADRARRSGMGARVEKRARRFGWAIIRSVFLIGFIFIIIYPCLTILSKAFMAQEDLYDNTVLWLPHNFTPDNVRYVMEQMSYAPSLATSAIITVGTTALQTFVCLLVGYGFARFNFKFKNLLFVIVILTILIPPQQIMIPIYLNFSNFDLFGLIPLLNGGKGLALIDSYWPFALLAATGTGLKNGLFIFIFRQFFRGMPLEIEEAAWVDGSGTFRTFLRVMLPNAMTAIATVILFSFVWQWNDVFYSRMFLSERQTIPMAYMLFEAAIKNTSHTSGSAGQLFNLADPRVADLLKNTGMFLVIIPLLAVYAVTQRFFVESIERTGIVG